MEALATIVLAHVAVKNMDLRPKGLYLGIMARRVLMAMKDEKMVDDRDYVGNKRLELYAYCVISSPFTDGLVSIVPDSFSHFYLRICSRPITRIFGVQSRRFLRSRPERVSLTLEWR